jgi:hypothetical protein
MSGEYEFEPIPGLPEDLPAGEKLLWQGSPNWKTLAFKALHIRGTAIYFAALLVWYFASKLTAGQDTYTVLTGGLRLVVLAVGTLALMALYAWLSAKTTLYTITSRRVVIRAGVALPMVLNLPFAKIESADLTTLADGGGDIALTLPSKDRVAYLFLWPHAQPWKLARARPMLRALPNVAAAAQILGRALAAAQPGSAQTVSQQDRETTRSSTHRPPRAAALA